MQLVLLLGASIATVLVLCAAATTPQESGAPTVPLQAKRLEAWVGTWDAEVTMMGQTTKGTETCRIECGGHWLVTEHTGSFMGMPFQGKGLTGWDAAKGAYTGVWVDSSGGPMSYFVNGRFAADGKSFVAQVDGTAMDGKAASFEYLSTFPDARTRVFEIFRVDGEKRELQMRIRYSKRA
ncbi:MAG: DUF1579 domain-containing protein [Planctomycetes bacterium]|nr:DUF1579 domain-containing protein [Planctomycetota bacterium]